MSLIKLICYRKKFSEWWLMVDVGVVMGGWVLIDARLFWGSGMKLRRAESLWRETLMRHFGDNRINFQQEHTSFT